MSFFVNSAYSSQDIDVLRGALNAWCSEKRIDITSTRAQFAASAALDLYHAGYDSDTKLLAALRGYKAL